jgi:hypothetical protein
LRGAREEELVEGFGGGECTIVLDFKVEVEVRVGWGGNDTSVAEFSLLLCSFIAAAAFLSSVDAVSEGSTLSLSCSRALGVLGSKLDMTRWGTAIIYRHGWAEGLSFGEIHKRGEPICGGTYFDMAL